MHRLGVGDRRRGDWSGKSRAQVKGGFGRGKERASVAVTPLGSFFLDASQGLGIGLQISINGSIILSARSIDLCF